jgi:protein-disulfide isomerase
VPARARVDLGAAPLRGDPTAPVTIVAFTDYECPYCRRQDEVLRRALASYPDRVRVAWKHFPLPHHTGARALAEAAACAHAQGRFFAVHDAFLAAGGRLRAPELTRVLGDARVDLDRYRADTEAGHCADAVDADLAEARALGVESSPTTFVNGVKLVGLRSLGELRALIEEESAPGVLSRVLDTN